MFIMNQIVENFQIFPNAPIREAIFEIGIKTMPNERVSDLEKLHSDFLNHYPELKPIQVFEKFFAIGDAPARPPQDNAWIQGYQMWASNNQELHTCRLDGFSYNRLKPYKDGNDAILKTLEGWNIFQRKIADAEIDRFVVRNINVIDIPDGRFKLKDYLRLSPDIPESLSANDITGFFSNVVLSFPEQKSECSITMAPQPNTNSGVSILLDIEARKSAEGVKTQEQIKSELECLKYVKDKVFFSLITDKAKELFR